MGCKTSKPPPYLTDCRRARLEDLLDAHTNSVINNNLGHVAVLTQAMRPYLNVGRTSEPLQNAYIAAAVDEVLRKNLLDDHEVYVNNNNLLVTPGHKLYQTRV